MEKKVVPARASLAIALSAQMPTNEDLLKVRNLPSSSNRDENLDLLEQVQNEERELIKVNLLKAKNGQF